MTHSDLLFLSVGLNVCFLAYFYAQRVKIAFLVHTVHEAKYIVDCLADGKATATRGRDGLLKFKEVHRETTQPSTPTI